VIIDKRVSGKTKNRSAFSIALLLAAGEFVGNYAQYQMSPIADRIMDQFGLSTTQFSGVFSAPMIPAIAFGIIAGVICDGIGPKRVVGAGLVITLLGTLLRYFATSYAGLFVSMVMIGFSISFINTCVTKCMDSWCPKEKVSIYVGYVFAGSSAGMVLGSATTAFLPSTAFAFLLSSASAAIVTFVWFRTMPDSRRNSSLHGEKIREVSMRGSLIVSFKRPTTWVAGGLAACVIGCNIVLVGLLPHALQMTGVTEKTAGLICSAITAGSFFGTLFGPRLTGKMQIRGALFVCTLMIGIGSAFGWHLPVVCMVPCIFVIGFCLGTAFALIVSLPAHDPGLGAKYAGSATGIITTIEMLGAVAIPTYIVAPIAGTNFSLLFFLGGAFPVVAAFLVCLLPKKTNVRESCFPA
jgi:NNP family nitrate/nitrite transporter-like MFS transporter